jgi:hypothetical protein
MQQGNALRQLAYLIHKVEKTLLDALIGAKRTLSEFNYKHTIVLA